MFWAIRLAVVLAVVVTLGGGILYFRAHAEPTELQPTDAVTIQEGVTSLPIDQQIEARICEIVETADGPRLDVSTSCEVPPGEPIPFGEGMPYTVDEHGEAHFLDAAGNTMWVAYNCYFDGQGPFSGVLIGPAKIRPTESEYRALPKCENAPRG